MKESHSAREMTGNWISGNGEGTSQRETYRNWRNDNRESSSNREFNCRLATETRDGPVQWDYADLGPGNQRVVDPKFEWRNHSDIPSQTSHETSELGRYDAQLQKSVLLLRARKLSWAEGPVNQASGGSHGHYDQGGSGRYRIVSSWVR